MRRSNPIVVTVTGIIPDTERIYVNIHLDYGLKGTTGYGKDADNDAVPNGLAGPDLIPDGQEYPFVVSDGNAIFRATVFQPLLVRSVRLEQIVVSFYGDSGARKDIGKLLPEIAISEINQAQAARRSYSTAFSISSTDKS